MVEEVMPGTDNAHQVTQKEIGEVLKTWLSDTVSTLASKSAIQS